MKTLLGTILFFLMFGWLGMGVALVYIIKYFWLILGAVFVYSLWGPFWHLMEARQGKPKAKDTTEYETY